MNSSEQAGPAQRGDERLCDNCGTAIRGAYCWRCGQPTRSFIKAMPAVVRDVANDTLSYDSRLWRTLKPLMLSPGFLSREYVSGRRARYSPPFRLYIVTSILAFLAVSFVVDTSQMGTGFGYGPGAEWVPPDAEPTPPSFQFGAEPWDAEDNPVELSWLGERGNAWLNRQIGRMAENTQEIQRNPGRFVRHLISMLPQMMFVLLPIYAVLVTVLYLFSGRYYIEHLVLQVHNHAFLFLVMIALILLGGMQNALAGTESAAGGFVASSMGWLSTLIKIWIPVYLFISIKRFYRQGWILTTLKFFILSIAYLVLFTLAISFTALIGILNL